LFHIHNRSNLAIYRHFRNIKIPRAIGCYSLV
jgi:hypothetical protein